MDWGGKGGVWWNYTRVEMIERIRNEDGEGKIPASCMDLQRFLFSFLIALSSAGTRMCER